MRIWSFDKHFKYKHFSIIKKRNKPVVCFLVIMIFMFLLFVFLNIFNIKRIVFPENFEPSITFCCIPYPVTNETIMKHKSVRDQNIIELYLMTMNSWLSTTVNSKILFLIPKSEFDKDNLVVPYLEEKFGSNKLFFVSEEDRVEGDDDDIPFIDDWFVKGFDYVTKNKLSELICFINSDIILPNGWYQRCKYLYYYFSLLNHRQTSIISRRCDFDYKFHKEYDFNPISFMSTIDYDEIAKERRNHSPWGMDFFLISMEPMELNIDEIPPFHMGKYRWDPWMAGWLRQNIPLVSLGEKFCTYHVNHRPKPRNMQEVKVKENFEIAAKNGRYNCGNLQANYFLKGNGLFYKNKLLITLPPNIPPENCPLETN